MTPEERAARERKQKIARRKRTQALLSHTGRHAKSGETPSGGKMLKVSE